MVLIFYHLTDHAFRLAGILEYSQAEMTAARCYISTQIKSVCGEERVRSAKRKDAAERKALEEDVRKLKEQVQELQEENLRLKKTNTELCEKMEKAYNDRTEDDLTD